MNHNPSFRKGIQNTVHTVLPNKFVNIRSKVKSYWDAVLFQNITIVTSLKFEIPIITDGQVKLRKETRCDIRANSTSCIWPFPE